MGVVSGTTLWIYQPGAYGFPMWTYTGVCTNDISSLRTLELYGVLETSLKLVLLPNSRELTAMATDGTTIVLQDITPNAYDQPIVGCVKLLPLGLSYLAPEQPTGASQEGNELIRFEVRYQQLKWNHV